MKNDEFVCSEDNVNEEFATRLKTQMPEDELFDLADFFKVFADSTRIKILWALHVKTMCVCDLAASLTMTKSAVSHQLKILRDANLVKYKKDGKNVFYSLSDDHVRKIFEMAIDHLEEL